MLVEGDGVHHDAETVAALRLWLRLLATVTAIERELARRLRQRFDCSLARFDLMAQLDRSPHGLSMSELSARLMVTNGNVTGLVQRLEREGLVARETDPVDRRLQRVRLTAEGSALFARIAQEHGSWVRERLGHLRPTEREALAALLARLRHPEASLQQEELARVAP